MGLDIFLSFIILFKAFIN